MDGIVPVRKLPPRFAAIAVKDEMELVDNEIRHGGLDCKLVSSSRRVSWVMTCQSKQKLGSDRLWFDVSRLLSR